MVLRVLSLACLISVSLFSLSQESGKAKPHVPVTKTVSKADIYVVGDVPKPTSGVMKDTGANTVLKALAMAGGTNPTASLHHAQIIRKSENGPIQVPVDIKEILAGKAPDVTLQPGDILFVPNAAVAVKLHKEYFYDVPPSGLQGPIYNR
jgi:protein involved in polysaccharide export with SLBB domain